MKQQFGVWVTPQLEVAHFLGVIGWFVVMYSGVRYGLRDLLTQQAGIVAALATTAIILCRHEAALLASVLPQPLVWSAASPSPHVRRRDGRIQ